MVNETQVPQTRTVGGERVALKAFEDFDFIEELKAIGLTSYQQKVAIGLMIGRMMSPGSDRHTYHWMAKKSSLLELLGGLKNPPCPSSFYRVSDALQNNQERFIDFLYRRSQKLVNQMNQKSVIVFYDLTHSYDTGKKRGHLLAYGRRKEKRSDDLLVTLALTMDRRGFPQSTKLYPGNISEPKTFRETVDALTMAEGTAIVMDRGITRQENLDDLAQKG